MSKYQPQRKVKIKWSPNFAYAVGLITSDGNLSKDKRHMSFKSAEEELIIKFKKALGLKNKIGKSARGGEKEKKYFQIYFGDIVFYRFLNKIGIHQAKSKTIKAVEISDKFFPDFLRGLFDGDGTFYTFWDKRWPNSFVYNTAFSSASGDFTKWLKSQLDTRYGINGVFNKGDGTLDIRYVKGDSRKLFNVMYYKKGLLFLERKYNKMRNAFLYDEKLSRQRKQKVI